MPQQDHWMRMVSLSQDEKAILQCGYPGDPGQWTRIHRSGLHSLCCRAELSLHALQTGGHKMLAARAIPAGPDGRKRDTGSRSFPTTHVYSLFGDCTKRGGAWIKHRS